MRLIDADILKSQGYYLQRTYQKDANTMVYETKDLDDIPTVHIEASINTIGKWIRTKTDDLDIRQCSICNYPFNMSYEHDWCPNCGARME